MELPRLRIDHTLSPTLLLGQHLLLLRRSRKQSPLQHPSTHKPISRSPTTHATESSLSKHHLKQTSNPKSPPSSPAPTSQPQPSLPLTPSPKHPVPSPEALPYPLHPLRDQYSRHTTPILPLHKPPHSRPSHCRLYQRNRSQAGAVFCLAHRRLRLGPRPRKHHGIGLRRRRGGSG